MNTKTNQNRGIVAFLSLAVLGILMFAGLLVGSSPAAAAPVAQVDTATPTVELTATATVSLTGTATVEATSTSVVTGTAIVTGTATAGATDTPLATGTVAGGTETPIASVTVGATESPTAMATVGVIETPTEVATVAVVETPTAMSGGAGAGGAVLPTETPMAGGGATLPQTGSNDFFVVGMLVVLGSLIAMTGLVLRARPRS